jgi:hypothetical protein
MHRNTDDVRRRCDLTEKKMGEVMSKVIRLWLTSSSAAERQRERIVVDSSMIQVSLYNCTSFAWKILCFIYVDVLVQMTYHNILYDILS